MLRALVDAACDIAYVPTEPQDTLTDEQWQVLCERRRKMKDLLYAEYSEEERGQYER
jgi:hypothetical protein